MSPSPFPSPATANVSPASAIWRDSQTEKATPSLTMPPAPRHAAPSHQIHSSSAYGPSQSAKRTHTVSATKYASPQQRLAHQMYQKTQFLRSIPTAPAAAVALRERLTNQSQRELKSSVVPVLTQAIREATDTSERQRLARALGQLGPARANRSLPCSTATARRRASSSVRPFCSRWARLDLPLVRRCRSFSSVFGVTAPRSAIVPPGHWFSSAPPHALWCRAFVTKAGDNAQVRDVMRRIDGPEGRIGIDDECECFSIKTIQQTQQEVRRLAATYQVEVLVETTTRSSKNGIDGAKDRARKG